MKVKSESEKSEDWPHLKLDFLQPDKIMDKQKRRPDHPDYDNRTLYVPEEFKAKVTPVSLRINEIFLGKVIILF